MTLIAHSEPSFSQDSICFTLDEAKHIFKLANKGRWCDSLSLNYEAQIDYLESTVKYQDAQIEIVGELVDKQTEVINDLSAKYAESERKRKNLRLLSAGLSIVVLVEGLVLFF